MNTHVLAVFSTIVLLGQSIVHAETFSVTNLISDDQAAHPAQITDPNLVNAWGIAHSGTSPFWVSDNATGVATLYSVNPTTGVTAKLGLTVSIPGSGSVTGQVFNGGAAGSFNGDVFLFVSEDGTISGWRGALGTSAETLHAASGNNVYKGAAQSAIGGHAYLYAANFRSGAIDVLKGDAAAPDLLGNFTDPNLPAGYAPFNVQQLGGRLYVAYALQDAGQQDEIAGAGNGFVDEFDLQGGLLNRIGTRGTLNAPWGMALAPASFGAFAGNLLVGNFGDGTINAFDLATRSFAGQLQDDSGNPLRIDGLWGLSAGNGGSAGNSGSIYFAAGPDDESHGLFGVIQREVPEPGALTLLLAGGLAGLRRRHDATLR